MAAQPEAQTAAMISAAAQLSPSVDQVDLASRRDSVASSSHSTLTDLRSPSHRSSFSSAYSRRRLRMLIVRHGETDCNVQGVIQGQLDTDLNAVGREQAKRVAAALANEHIDEVYASPLRRARDTATAIVQAHPNHAHGRMSYWLDDRLKERGFGSLEGRTFDRSRQKRDSIDGIEQMMTCVYPMTKPSSFCQVSLADTFFLHRFAARLSSFVADVAARPAPFVEESTREDTVSEWVDESQTRLAASEGVILSDGTASSPPPNLNKAGCSRTIVIVAHGAAISAMVGAVLLDTGLACMSAGVQRTRVWNCSITEVIVEDTDMLPRTKRAALNMEEVAGRPGKKAFVIERWAGALL